MWLHIRDSWKHENKFLLINRQQHGHLCMVWIIFELDYTTSYSHIKHTWYIAIAATLSINNAPEGRGSPWIRKFPDLGRLLVFQIWNNVLFHITSRNSKMISWHTDEFNLPSIIQGFQTNPIFGVKFCLQHPLFTFFKHNYKAEKWVKHLKTDMEREAMLLKRNQCKSLNFMTTKSLKKLPKFPHFDKSVQLN